MHCVEFNSHENYEQYPIAFEFNYQLIATRFQINKEVVSL